MIYTQDGMQHMFFGFRHFKEMYCVLDHAWRDPTPTYSEGSIIPEYSNPEFITNSLQQQMQAFQKLAEFKAESNTFMTQQQFQQQQNQIPSSQQEFLQQQQSLQSEPPLYPYLG